MYEQGRLCGFTNKHSGAVKKTDVFISNVHCSDDVRLCPGSSVFKTFAGNVLFRSVAIIVTGKDFLEAISPKFSSENMFFMQ